MHQSQEEWKGQKLVSGTTPRQGSGKAAGTPESGSSDWSGIEAQQQRRAGSVSKGYGLEWVQSKDSSYRTGLQSCPLHHREVFHKHLLGGWLLTINLVGSVFGLAGKQRQSACRRTCPHIAVSHYII